MDMNQVLQGLDQLFETGKLEQVEEYLTKQMELAVKEDDFGAILSILNELLGFARENSQYDKCEIYGSRALKLGETSPYRDGIYHATTLLNVANAMRAAGRLKESGEHYKKAETIYDSKLPKGDVAFASLYNNEALLYEEMGEYENAKKALEKALEVLSSYEKTEYQQAVSYANLANTMVMLKRMEEAREYAIKALQLFAPLQVEDSHKGAALAALGEVEASFGNMEKAVDYYQQAENCILHHIGKNAAYLRVHERLMNLKEHSGKGYTGAELCKAYYEMYGVPMLAEKFPEYVSRIATGHVGEGSDCFGFDDAVSRDHDFGPGFSMWVTKETYEEIGEALQEAYMSLPDTFHGYQRVNTSYALERNGVCIIEDFYERVLSGGHLPQKEEDYLALEDCYLACAVNGEVYRDEEGIFSAIRNQLKAGYPEGPKLLKIAQAAALFGQNGQYNYARTAKREEWTAALLAKTEAVKQGMRLAYLLADVYAPHDKWMHRGLKEMNSAVYSLVEQLTDCDLKDVKKTTDLFEKLSILLLEQMRKKGYVTMEGTFLPDVAVEIARRGQYAMESMEELVDAVVMLEWKAFDKVKNVGGRAGCQDDWETFQIMRKSQYLTWNRTMLIQYRLDFEAANMAGRNLISEKYARMMESTVPEEYKAIEKELPVIPKEKKAIMESILSIQVQWMEEFAARYPGLAKKARIIHTSEDKPWDTSYETYLRGELSTYSDAMLELYGRFIVEIAKNEQNLAKMIMMNTVKMYGYESLEEAHRKLERD